MGSFDVVKDITENSAVIAASGAYSVYFLRSADLTSKVIYGALVGASADVAKNYFYGKNFSMTDSTFRAAAVGAVSAVAAGYLPL